MVDRDQKNTEQIRTYIVGFFNSDEQGTSSPSSDRLPGKVRTLEEKGKSTFKVAYGTLDQIGEKRGCVVLVDLIRIPHILYELSDAFGVCFRNEGVAFGLEEKLDWLVISDYAVVDDRKFGQRV